MRPLTHATGAPVAGNLNIQTAGPRGPALLQDINTPVFVTRDPLRFPDLNHAVKRDPRTNLRSAHNWDFWSLLPKAARCRLAPDMLAVFEAVRYQMYHAIV